MLKVAVLFGGDSVEHEVSIISAMQAMAALNEKKYKIIPLYLAKNHKFYSAASLKHIETYKDLDLIEKTVTQVSVVRENQKFFLKPLARFKQRTEIDLVIPVVHGTHCEDGSVAGFLETLGIPYSGCDVLGGAVGQDKVVMKQILENAKLPIVDWVWFYAYEFEKDSASWLKKIDLLGYPVVVKPANLGSSVGITLAKDEKEVIAAIDTASQYDVKICIEKAVTNLRELNCSVLGYYDKKEASVLEEVMKQDTILSYDNKYKGSNKAKGMASATRNCPAKVSDQLTKEVQGYALETFRVLGAAGVCRIDFLLDDETKKVYVNEINTIPGSLSFYLWEATGKPFPKLMDDLVDIAIRRTRQKEKMIFSYTTNILSNYKNGGAKGSKIKTSR
jgi:D-alanine-D-alanine ligase